MNLYPFNYELELLPCSMIEQTEFYTHWYVVVSLTRHEFIFYSIMHQADIYALLYIVLL